MDLTGKVALITGAAGGQGQVQGRRLFAAGARVVLTDIAEEHGHEMAGELGDGACYAHHDVSSERDWARAVDLATDTFGRLDVVVNNAAIYTVAAVTDQEPADFRRVLEIDLIGTFLGVRAAIAPMRTAGGGSIINISSQAGMQGIRGHAAYGSAKWGVRGLIKTAALELGEYGIRCNSVHPGAIDTPMVSHAGFVRGPGNHPVPLGRVGVPEDVAGIVAFLASDESAYISGGEFTVDGGAMAGRPSPSGPR